MRRLTKTAALCMAFIVATSTLPWNGTIASAKVNADGTIDYFDDAEATSGIAFSEDASLYNLHVGQTQKISLTKTNIKEITAVESSDTSVLTTGAQEKDFFYVKANKAGTVIVTIKGKDKWDREVSRKQTLTVNDIPRISSSSFDATTGKVYFTFTNVTNPEASILVNYKNYSVNKKNTYQVKLTYVKAINKWEGTILDSDSAKYKYAPGIFSVKSMEYKDYSGIQSEQNDTVTVYNSTIIDPEITSTIVDDLSKGNLSILDKADEVAPTCDLSTFKMSTPVKTVNSYAVDMSIKAIDDNSGVECVALTFNDQIVYLYLNKATGLYEGTYILKNGKSFVQGMKFLKKVSVVDKAGNIAYYLDKDINYSSRANEYYYKAGKYDTSNETYLDTQKIYVSDLSFANFYVEGLTNAKGIHIVSDVTAFQSEQAFTDAAKEYSNTINDTWVYTAPNYADSIQLTFSNDTVTAKANYTAYSDTNKEQFKFYNAIDAYGEKPEYIIVFDGNNKKIGFYSEEQLKNGAITIAGDTVKVYFCGQKANADDVSKFGVTSLNPKYSTRKVLFDANGGTTKITGITVGNNQAYGALPVPTRAGYKFLGWYTKKTGGSKIISTTIASIASSQTLYARWEKAKKNVVSAKVSWSKVSSAKGYKVYYVNGKKSTLIKTITSNKTISYTVSKLNSKALKANTSYKFKVVAYKTVKNKNKTVKTYIKTVKATKKKITVPTTSKVSKLTAKNNAFLVNVSNVKSISGYQIAYSLKKTSGFKTVTLGTKKSKTISKLKNKKTYYVKVRTYITEGQTKVYSPYSGIKSVKTK